MAEAAVRPGSGNAATRVLRASSASSSRLISSNQKQKAGCFGGCLCALGLIGPTLATFAMTYMLQEQVDYGREPKVERYNQAVQAWADGGEAELRASSFALRSEVDGREMAMETVAEPVPLDDKGSDLPDPPSAPSHARYSGAGTGNPPLLMDRAYDAPHRSTVNVIAQYGGGAESTLALEFLTFQELRYRASKVACDAAHGHWSGDVSSRLNGWCTGRTAASSVCAVIERGGTAGDWRLVGAAGAHPGCSVSYTPSALFGADSAHRFTGLEIVLRHAESPYLTAAAEAESVSPPAADDHSSDAAVQSKPPPWHFGQRSEYTHR
jgi:hypothetical protein